MARVRSPNYPALSLPAALERVRTLHKVEARNPASREAIAKHLGFGSLNGASATILSALTKYGLIESVGDGEARVSDLAMRILFPHEPEEKAAALQEAAFKPALFNELKEKWPDRAPSDESLRSYLTRNGFSQTALDQVIQFYRETLDIASSSTPVDNDGRQAPITKDASMDTAPVAPVLPAPVPTPPPLAGRPFTVSFDGSVLTGTLAIRSVRDIERLMKVLQAQKAALEAMMDDDDAIAAEDPFS